MPIVDTTGWASLSSPTGGSGDIVLTQHVVATESTAAVRAKYYIEAPVYSAQGVLLTTLWEYGIGAVLSSVLYDRQVIASSSGTSRVIFPTTGVTVYLDSPVAEVGDGAVFADGDYGDIIVGDVGTSMSIQAGTVNGTTHIVDASIPPAKLENATTLSLATLQTELGVPATSGRVCKDRHYLIGVANGTHTIEMAADFPYTITALRHRGSEALTITAVNIVATAITGLTAVAVTTSIATATATAANAVVVGNSVDVVLADIATTADVYLEFVVTRG